MKRILPLALTVLLFTGCSTDNPTAINSASDGAVTSASSPEMVPFKSSWSTTSTFTGPNSLIIFGVGRATHMGQSSFEGPSQVDPETGFQTGTSTMIGADGDEVSIAYEGQTFPLDGGSAVGFSGAYSVTSGTGKFFGATGGGTYEGSFSFVTATGQLELSGTISRPVDLDENEME